MNALGIGPRDVVSLARHSRRTLSPKGPILVTGVLAEQLATELRAGGDASFVRTHGDPADAAAVVCVVGEAATPSDEEVLRAATRALVPVIGVRTGSSRAPIPYVLATDVVDVPPGQGFPLDEIAGTLAAALGVGPGHRRDRDRCRAAQGCVHVPPGVPEEQRSGAAR